MPDLIRWSVPVAIMAMLWLSSSSSPQPREPDLIGGLVHNSMHVIAFAALSGSLWLALHSWRGSRVKAVSLAAIALAVAYGLVDEFHQSYVPGRVSSVADVLSDASGAMLAVAWLRCRIGRVLTRAWVFVGLGLASLASVCLATFGPW